MRRDAYISLDGRYRYWLSRRWGNSDAAVFVMLNPSTADALVDDPTIRRCVGFAKDWGCGGVFVVNLYAYRATKPADLWTAADPVGPDNDANLTVAAEWAADYDAPLIAAWGANAKPDRVARVLALPGMGRLQCLGVTKAGQPRHPLYLRAGTARVAWPIRADAS